MLPPLRREIPVSIVSDTIGPTQPVRIDNHLHMTYHIYVDILKTLLISETFKYNLSYCIIRLGKW